jgi:pyrrolidone-carboxylate peptidase
VARRVLVPAAWNDAGIPGRLSEPAGTSVCNHFFYEVLALNARSIPTGFVHVPCTPEVVPGRAVEAALAAGA